MLMSPPSCLAPRLQITEVQEVEPPLVPYAADDGDCSPDVAFIIQVTPRSVFPSTYLRDVPWLMRDFRALSGEVESMRVARWR